MPIRPLTEREARFVNEYLVDGNGARAAVTAGYGVAGSRVQACRLLTRANVRKALDDRQQADADRLALDRENVVAGLLEAVAMARQQRDPMAMLSGFREIGKMMGFYPILRTKIDVDVTTTTTVHNPYLTMTNGQLQDLIDASPDPERTLRWMPVGV